MAKKLSDRRERDALHDSVRGQIVTKIMKPDILDPGTFAHERPKGSVAKFGSEVVNCLCRLERGIGG